MGLPGNRGHFGVLGPGAARTEEYAHLLATFNAVRRHHGQLTVVTTGLGGHRNSVRRSPHVAEHRVELRVAPAVLLRNR